MTNPSTTFQLEPYPQELFDAVIAAVPRWIEGRVVAIATAELGTCPDTLRTTLAEICNTTVQVVAHDLASLLSVDVDAQQTNPLHVLRNSTGAATQALRDASVTAVRRDEFEVRAMPNDVYAIGPLTWRDLGDDVHDAGITWGAWKAAVVLSRRRAEGKIS
jgi:hypothetical protein